MSSKDLTTIKIARICHEAHKALCNALGEFGIESWGRLSRPRRDVCIGSVEAMIASPKVTSEMSHQMWLDHMVSTGWKYGPEKNPDLKEHPCIVPFSELPIEQKKKDELFAAIVRVLK